LAQGQRRGGLEGAAVVRLGGRAVRAGRRAGLAALAPGAAPPRAGGGAGVLPLSRAGRHRVARAGPGRRVEVDDRGGVRAGQGGLRSGRVRGAVVGGLVPARHAVAVRAGGADGDPGAGRIPAGPERKGGLRLIPLTVPAVRALLLRVAWGRLTPAERA